MPKDNPSKYDELLRRALARKARGKGGKRTKARIDAALGKQRSGALLGRGKLPVDVSPKQKGSGGLKQIPERPGMVERGVAPKRSSRGRRRGGYIVG